MKLKRNKNRGIFSTRKARIASGALKKLFCLKQRSCKFIIFSVTKIRVAKENPTSRVFATFCGQRVVQRTDFTPTNTITSTPKKPHKNKSNATQLHQKLKK
jgi:hypothetical protein